MNGLLQLMQPPMVQNTVPRGIGGASTIKCSSEYGAELHYNGAPEDGIPPTIRRPVTSTTPVSTPPSLEKIATTPLIQEATCNSKVDHQDGILSGIGRNILEGPIQAGAGAARLESEDVPICQAELDTPTDAARTRAGETREVAQRSGDDAMNLILKNEPICTCCGSKLTRFRWKKKIKKEVKSIMRWTSKVMYSMKCETRNCDRKGVAVPDKNSGKILLPKLKPEFSQNVKPDSSSVSKGGGACSKTNVGSYYRQLSSFHGGGKTVTEEISTLDNP